MNILFSPYRSNYQKKDDVCPFCQKIILSDEHKYDHLIIYRSKYSAIILNLHPYNPGHLLVIPKDHIADILDLSEEAYIDLSKTLLIATKAAKIVNNAEDLNIGMNMGKASGGSIPSHLHVHVIPRYLGDTGFLTVIDQTRLITKDLKSVYDSYQEYFDKLKINIP